MVVVIDATPVTPSAIVVVGKPVAADSIPIVVEASEVTESAPAEERQAVHSSSIFACLDPSIGSDDYAEVRDAPPPAGKSPEEKLSIVTGSPKTGSNREAQSSEIPGNATLTSPEVWSNWTCLSDPGCTMNPEMIVVEARSAPPMNDDDDDDDDNSETGGTLLGDLPSVPSEQGVASVPQETASLGLRSNDTDTNKNIASVVESKAKKITIPQIGGNPGPANQEKHAAKNKGSTTETAPEKVDQKRNVLVKELRRAISTYGRYDVRCAKISASLGDFLDENGQHDHAIKLHKDAVTIYSCKLGEDHATTMDGKMRLGAVLENAGQLDEAIDTYYMVTSMRRCLVGERDSSVADGMVHMARALRLKNDFVLAIKELKRALKIYRDSLGDSHEKVSTTVDEIASLYVTMGDFNKSATILEEVTKLKAAIHGPNSKEVAATLTNLSTSYECSEQLDKAMKSLKKAYKIYTADGYSSEEATQTLGRMAQLYESWGDYNRASIAYLGVLRGRKLLYGEDHLSVGEVYYKLGHSLHETGQSDKALKCMKEALPIYVKKAVEIQDIETIAEIMHETALINMEKNRKTDAARIFKQELGVRRKMGQPEYPIIAKTLNHLGVVEYELSNYTHALKYLVEALTIFQGKGENSLDCAEVLFNTGLVFEAVKNKDRALEAYGEAARIFSDNGYQNDHPHITRANHKINKLKLKKSPRNSTPRNATPRNSTPRNATPRHATPRNSSPHDVSTPSSANRLMGRLFK